MKRFQISRSTKKPAITITREAIKRDKLVYIALANKAVRYRSKRSSRVVYIGTTEKGINRIAASGASRAKKILNKRGIKRLDFYVVFAKRGRQRVQSIWRKLECSLIQAFKERFYEPPILNTVGKNKDWEKYYKYFSRTMTRRLITEFSEMKG